MFALRVAAVLGGIIGLGIAPAARAARPDAADRGRPDRRRGRARARQRSRSTGRSSPHRSSWRRAATRTSPRRSDSSARTCSSSTSSTGCRSSSSPPPSPARASRSPRSNLALSLVAAGRQVLLIEADLRRPRISDYFGIDRSVGLTDVLIGRAALDEVLQLDPRGLAHGPPERPRCRPTRPSCSAARACGRSSRSCGPATTSSSWTHRRSFPWPTARWPRPGRTAWSSSCARPRPRSSTVMPLAALAQLGRGAPRRRRR